MRRDRHAKIVATVGPASASPDMLKALFLAGVDVFRLNFSHGTQERSRRRPSRLSAVLSRTWAGRSASCRTCKGRKSGSARCTTASLRLRAATTVRFVLGTAEGGKDAIPLPHPEVFEAIAPGQEILIDDGRVRVSITGSAGMTSRPGSPSAA